MAKIIDKIKADAALNQVFCSFEFFPPKTSEGVDNLIMRVERMAKCEPLFVDVTWAAGGESSALTMSICKTISNFCQLNVNMHLTCTNMPRSKVKEALDQAKAMGIVNILALRGDPPKGSYDWTACDEGFEHAADLVKFIRETYGAYFGISVAGFPEGHVESTSYDDDLKYLKAKVDAGADFIITQLFYDIDSYFKFESDCRSIGITVPIVPGIMAIQNYKGFTRMTQYCQIKVPQHIMDALEPIKDDDEAVKDYGIQLGVETCQKLIERGACGIHFYTLNLERSVKKILEGIGLSTAAKRTLPWRPSVAPKRKGEEVRPIFWANRPKSYMIRTDSWDEFPNGRWGDARSPAFGELGDSHFYGIAAGPLDERKQIWGESPMTTQDVYQVFAGYINGTVPKLPWCEQSLDLETGAIKNDLVLLNSEGFLTINSQPRLNGVKSDDPLFGWGGKGGLVYQKAYLEFFASPALLRALMDKAADYPSLTYHAVDVKGNTYSNAKSTTPSAVTWGVFPNKEVQQPTVVDPQSFLVWKDEAFRLWLLQWASIYNEESQSHELLYNIHDTFFLVNVVDNNFVSGNIFDVFLKIIAEQKEIMGRHSDSGRDAASSTGRRHNGMNFLINFANFLTPSKAAPLPVDDDEKSSPFSTVVRSLALPSNDEAAEGEAGGKRRRDEVKGGRKRKKLIGGLPVKSFVCSVPQCLFRGKDKYALTRHMTQAHSEKPHKEKTKLAKEGKGFKCNRLNCLFAGKDNYALSRHISSHLRVEAAEMKRQASTKGGLPVGDEDLAPPSPSSRGAHAFSNRRMYGGPLDTLVGAPVSEPASSASGKIETAVKMLDQMAAMSGGYLPSPSLHPNDNDYSPCSPAIKNNANEMTALHAVSVLGALLTDAVNANGSGNSICPSPSIPVDGARGHPGSITLQLVDTDGYSPLRTRGRGALSPANVPGIPCIVPGCNYVAPYQKALANHISADHCDHQGQWGGEEPAAGKGIPISHAAFIGSYRVHTESNTVQSV